VTHRREQGRRAAACKASERLARAEGKPAPEARIGCVAAAIRHVALDNQYRIFMWCCGAAASID
jgi:hypothetical protein